MSTLLIRNISTLVTCDDQDQILSNVDMYVEDGFIVEIGPNLIRQAGRVLEGKHMICYPGLVNTHHHLYQIFSRNLPGVQGLELFPWLRALYGIWENLDEEVLAFSTMIGTGQLMKNGCTTCFDHHYIFPKNGGDLIAAQFAAAETMGIRFYAARGSMDLSVKDGGLPPDSVVQTVDEILKDSQRLIEQYHDPSSGSMRQIALAPCSPFSVSSDLLRESADLARAAGVRLHTHLGETLDEEAYVQERYGMRPLAYMESLGWVGPDVWYAHGIHFNNDELSYLAASHTGVAHCPISNMKLCSGVARVPEMLNLGVPLGLAVDGSASNDGSNLLEELRVAYLLHRLASGTSAPSGYELLKVATRGGAALLGRSDIGSLEPGKCCDLFMIDDRRLELVAATADPAAVLCTVGINGPVDRTIVHGLVTVEQGQLTRIDEEEVAAEAQACVNRYLK